MAIRIVGHLDTTPKPVARRQQDDLPDWLKGTVTFSLTHSRFSGQPNKHTGYYITRGNRQIAVELLEVDNQIHWYELTYDTLWDHYEVDETDRLEIDNPAVGYFDIDDPRHVDYVPATETFHKPEEEFLAGGIHHVATLQGPQSQLSPTHPVLPVIEQAAAQGEEIPVDIAPIALTSAVVIQNPVPPPPVVIQPPPMAQPANIQGNILGQLQQQAAGQQAAPARQQQQQAALAGQQQAQPVAGQPVQINANGALKGNPPAVFNGDCTKSSGFLVAFKLFKAAN